MITQCLPSSSILNYGFKQHPSLPFHKTNEIRKQNQRPDLELLLMVGKIFLLSILQ